MLNYFSKATDTVSSGARIPNTVFLAPELFPLCSTGILGMWVWQKLSRMVWDGFGVIEWREEAVGQYCKSELIPVLSDGPLLPLGIERRNWYWKYAVFIFKLAGLIFNSYAFLSFIFLNVVFKDVFWFLRGKLITDFHQISHIQKRNACGYWKWYWEHIGILLFLFDMWHEWMLIDHTFLKWWKDSTIIKTKYHVSFIWMGEEDI